MKCFNEKCWYCKKYSGVCDVSHDCEFFISESKARAGARSVTGRSIGSPEERSEAGIHAETEGKPQFSGERSSPENASGDS